MSAAVDWRGLEAALAACPRPPEMWLRDDDAVAAGPALERLLALTEAHGIAPVLAVIPDRLTASLAPRLAGTRALVAAHGWRHDNHAGPGAKKAEFGADRPLAPRAREAAAGLTRLRDAFGARCAPLFVPPWNRIAEDMGPALGAAGYRGLSTFRPRTAPWAAPGVARLNTHWDPIDWPAQRAGGPALRPAQAVIDALAESVAHWGAGSVDAEEPIGLLTHHLAHDAAVWDLLDALLARLEGRVIWVDLRVRLGSAASH